MTPGESEPPDTDRTPLIGSVRARAFRIPTDGTESDATLSWDATTLVVVDVDAGAVHGLGWTYDDTGCVALINDKLAAAVVGQPLLDVPRSWMIMQHELRNVGRPGMASCALSAVDIALWDAAARTLELPLSDLLGRCHDQVPVYGSGGFTSQTEDELIAQLRRWVVELRLPRVKIKIGEDRGKRIDRDLDRIRLARDTIGDVVDLLVDANGGYSVGQARRVGHRLDDLGVTWFEEPVSSDDHDGLGLLRQCCAADIAAGEYGYDLAYFASMVPVVDCLQIDVTRCGGYTEWRRAAAVAAAANREVSAHCAPNLSVPVAASTQNFRHIEWFVDHERIESELFDGCLDPTGGEVAPRSAIGHGLSLREEAAAVYAV
ncbi:enolase C-terminal domain-like protein [Microlunatus soli]|uniref:L-alanine-DL-glutamate epimerase n=1 Tax=Microlunatus soli TaxID=630515 RepID=A0A1H1N4D5_9ACTN|nr:enolase C-terminal domain-like protein [Microlunatus soli]SDR93913.1 L-alanine-DL-glutamate epimerase [Microlunatus soli]